MTTRFHVCTNMMKLKVNKRVLLLDNDVDMITYTNKMYVNEQISIHDNKVSRVY